MFSINLDISNGSLIALNDVMRMFIIQLVAQVLFSINNNTEIFSLRFVENTIFVLLGIVVYWMVFNNIMIFKNKSDDEPHNNYYQSAYSVNGLKI